MELTREYFEEYFDKTLDEKLDAKFDQKLAAFATKDDLISQTQELKNFAITQTEELAQIIGRSFVEQHEYLEGKFTTLEDKIDVRERVQTMEYKFFKLEDTLNIKL